MVACESSFVVGGASGFLCMSDVVGELKRVLQSLW